MAKLGQYGEQLATMTVQEVFDAAAIHLLEQGKRSTKMEDGRSVACLYDGGEVCCAAAPFMFKEKYTPAAEGKDWELVCSLGCAHHNHQLFIKQIQKVHDFYINVLDWPKQLKLIAKGYELDPKCVVEFEKKQKGSV